MYRGYNICKSTIDTLFNTVGYSNIANIDDFYETQKNAVNRNINNILQKMEESVLDAEVIQNEWFPEINADVFISHSHKDLSLAKVFAGWLLKQFGITSFIDSCIWGYANDLLKIIDKKYCRNDQTNSYSYDKRNYSTAHIHIMLMTALNKMIDKTECVFFLNTTNSNIGHEIESKTLSPWIYGEIETCRLIQKRRPNHKRIRVFSQGGKILFENLEMKYPLDLGHFYAISPNELVKWGRLACESPQDALDELYEITSKKE